MSGKEVPEFEYDPEATVSGLIKVHKAPKPVEWPNAYYRCPECGGHHSPQTFCDPDRTK